MAKIFKLEHNYKPWENKKSHILFESQVSHQITMKTGASFQDWYEAACVSKLLNIIIVQFPY